jgi:Cof subfamily protein (haloacid dehalogenase superfamily)
MSFIRLLLADVDGTLLTSNKVLTERARQAVLRLREARISFAITSGRPPRGMSMLVGPLALTTPMGAFNGGALVKPDFSLLEQKCIPAAVVQPILSEIWTRGLDVWVYRGSDWLARDPRAPHVDREQRTVQFQPTIVPDFSDVSSGVIKIVGVSDDLHLVEQCEAQLRDRFADHVSAARSQAYYLDVTHPDANKGAVVRRLSELLDVPREQIATIGDMPNDVLMFAGSGLSIAMGNASRDVQRCARVVTTSNNDEGFANAVEQYVLPAEGRPGAVEDRGTIANMTAGTGH